MCCHLCYRGDEEYLFVNDVGIRTGDSFQFYATDSNLARSTSNYVSEAFKLLKDDFEKKHQANNAKESVFGGLIFACCGRGEPFFGHAKIDSQPFLDNFPGVTIAGSFCNGELKRGHSIGYGEEAPRDLPCSVHAFSTVYLVLSYISAENSISMAGQSSGESGCCSGATFIDAVNVDLLYIILSRLPARSFASAACVNRSWKSICSRILSSPKFSSAFSLNQSMEVRICTSFICPFGF